MAPQEQKYIVRKPDGEELPAADAETLVQWVHDHHITRDCEIRPSLVPRWTLVTKYEFLRNALDEAQPPKKPKRKLSGQKKRQPPKPGMSSPGLAVHRTPPYSPAGSSLRILAGIFDSVILAIFCGVVVIFAPVPAAFSHTENLFIIALCFAGALLYYTWCLGFRAQTLGQQFWGVMLIKKDTGPVFAARAAVFSLFTLILGVPSIILVALYLMRHTIAEKITNTRAAFIRVRYIMPS